MDKLKAAWVGFRQPDADPWKVYERYAAIGYHGMDGDLWEMEGDRVENLKHFNDLGLQVVSSWAVRGDMEEFAADDQKIAEVIERAHFYNLDAVTMGGISVISSFNSYYGNNGTYDELMYDIEGMNAVIEKLGREGIGLLYHNHYQEFTVSYDGVSVMDYLLTDVDRRLKLKLDVGWVWVGGVDPVAFMEKAKDRIGLLHIKDFYDQEIPRHLVNQKPETRIGFTMLGTGKVDIQGCLKKGVEIGQKWAIVEQDTMRNLTMEEDLTGSFLAMKESGYVE